MAFWTEPQMASIHKMLNPRSIAIVGATPRMQYGGRFLAAALATAERTSQALAWETSARVSLAEKNSDRALECITKGLSTMVGFETPLAAWRVDATAAEVYESMGSPDMATRHRESSRATSRQLADSLANERVLRNIFLSSPVVATIL